MDQKLKTSGLELFTEKQRDGSLFGNALVNNRITSIFLNRKEKSGLIPEGLKCDKEAGLSF